MALCAISLMLWITAPLTNGAAGGNAPQDHFIVNEDMNAMSESPPAPTPDPEVIYVDKRRISCDGGGGALGHPVVWYSLEDGEAECGYCDRKFIFKSDKDAH